MKTLEFEGKTTEGAIEKACRELNLSEDELDVEIIEPGSAGIFGLVGGRKAKIRVIVNEEEEPEEISDENDGSYVSFARETLQDILNLIPAETTVTGGKADGRIVLNIEGDKSGLLIGRKGRTLDALQFIVNKIANKTLDKKVHVVVDTENYRQRRRDSLIQMAHRMGEKAKKIKKSVATNPLNPHDRRIVHLALKEDKEVDTRSRGDGILKKVIILPRRNR